MDNNILLAKILTECIDKMEESGSVTIGQYNALKHYLAYAYTIGHEDGYCQISHRKKVHQIKNGKIVETFLSIAQAAKSVNGDPGTISSIINGTPGRYSHKGFQWKYA